MFKISKLNVIQDSNFGNSNILEQYEIQKASWIWHPDYLYTEEPHVVNFKCEFEIDNVAVYDNTSLEENMNVIIHVSADNRYELYLDGKLISRGPDRCDLFHWSFASYKLQVPHGKHKLSARCWWLGKEAPAAQQTFGRGGFILAAEGKYSNILNTDGNNWRVSKEEGWSFENKPFIYVGALSTIDTKFKNKIQKYLKPAIVFKPLGNDPHGQIRDGWRLQPSSLPEQKYCKVITGKIRAVYNHNSFITKNDIDNDEIVTWQEFLETNKPVIIAPNKITRILIDLEEYYCAYTSLTLSKGKNSIIKTYWAESLYEDNTKPEPIQKGNRNEILNKFYYGRADTIIQDGSLSSNFQNIWWRSGRYILLDIETSDEELIIEKCNLHETGYPLKNESVFQCSENKINNIIPLAVRGMQMCSHETFMDCPFYEQLMYVGDSRLEMLVSHVMTRDDRLIKRGLELFDWSRYSTGFIHERYPSTPQQLSVTFSMIWIAALKDYAWWKSDSEWVKQRMVGMRSLLDNIIHLRNSEGLLEDLPGWSFVDWVPEWELGVPADGRKSISSIINLFFVMALKNAAELEKYYGHKIFSDYYSDIAKEVSCTINELFWDENVGLLADNQQKTSFSEHAQCLALIYDVIKTKQQQRALNNLISKSDLHRATVYFSFYLLETFFKHNRGSELIQKLDFWKELQSQGFKTPVEMPEPSRSDCHAWGSHPLFHFHASIAGIRPDSPEFKTVRITPNPGNLKSIESSIPHPAGEISLNLKFNKSTVSGTITLPESIPGKFIYNAVEIKLKAGENIL